MGILKDFIINFEVACKISYPMRQMQTDVETATEKTSEDAKELSSQMYYINVFVQSLI